MLMHNVSMNGKKPIVGIVAKPYTMPKHLWHRCTVVDDLRFMVVQNGGIAIAFLSSESTLNFHDGDEMIARTLDYQAVKDLDQELSLCQGMILQGGLSCNYYEVVLAKLALAHDMPILGICAGFNNLLRAVGGDVKYDKTERHNIEDKDYRHPVKIMPGTKMAEILGETEIKTNSIHNMIATPEMVKPFAKINALSEDGLVEGIEIPGKRFAVGTKWHPEIMAEEPTSQKLFQAFMQAVAEYQKA